MIEGNQVEVGKDYMATNPCAKMTCNGAGSYSGVGCTFPACKGESKTVPGPAKPYPECCPTVTCA
uniref:PXCC family protein n=4 Tax=Scytodes thoracica TaxID=1112478 RepID=A0A0A0V6B2_SCYTH|nr:PXCC family protein [Scytodes thoracica]AIW62474.1 PXCC family protein [Scytodes thoracica]AIW62572.1 PXCC family protein [Scytodes thoracica]